MNRSKFLFGENRGSGRVGEQLALNRANAVFFDSVGLKIPLAYFCRGEESVEDYSEEPRGL